GENECALLRADQHAYAAHPVLQIGGDEEYPQTWALSIFARPLDRPRFLRGAGRATSAEWSATVGQRRASSRASRLRRFPSTSRAWFPRTRTRCQGTLHGPLKRGRAATTSVAALPITHYCLTCNPSSSCR